MDDLLLKVILRLAGIYETMGQRVYLDAGHRALLGIARAAQAEAERQSPARNTTSAGPVVPFPLAEAQRRSETRKMEDGGTDA